MMTRLVPKNCKTLNQICKLSHDNVGVERFSIMTDGYKVYLTEQPWGENPIQKFEIKRTDFNKLIKWWVTGIVPKEDKASRTPPRKKK